MIRTQNRIVPGLFGLLVVGLGATLVTVFLRSPDTHANLVPGYSASYVRTAQIPLGSPVPFVPAGQTKSTADQVAYGRQLFFANYCASCHGERGQGGAFAPPIAGFDLQTLTQRVHVGPGGMPVFSDQTLTADQLAAIEAYLLSVVPKR
jgi:mono/diheme cytochrome c family protein